jgi:PDZ domain-containing secreted protein
MKTNKLTSSFTAILALMALTIFFAPSPARAESALDFVLVNDTGYTIDKIFVSPTKIEAWGEDVMGQDQLEDGKSVKIHFSREHEKDTKWDIKVVFTDDENRYWTGLDLSAISEVTIHYKDDHATATWK